MSPQTLKNRPARSAATLAAVLAFGAGGGAAATFLLNDNAGSTTRTVTAAAGAPISTTTTTSNASAVYSKVKNGVVDITVTSRQASQQSPFGGPGSQGGPGSTATAEGSGFVIDKAGHIVTNEHVVAGANSIQVKFADGTKASAKLVGTDASNDVAVLKVDGVDPSKLTQLSFADSGTVKVGDAVYALGSPYGLADSFTAGIVSALGRSITAPNNYTISGAIQTDASINHGNSGGPLLNTSGQVIGVNAQIQSDSGDNSGVGFAIQSSQIKNVADQIIAGHSVSHPYLGLQLTDGTGGATVAAITNGSPAGKAGVRTGDTIVAIDGESVSGSNAVISAVQSHKVGDKVDLTLRRSGKQQTITVTLGNRSGSSSS
jgi:putative serine protease PepD